jgi:undecaprenyl-diphosphatase
MWFADIGVVMAWAAIAGWVLVATLALVLPRLGQSSPALLPTVPTRVPLLVGTAAVALLFAAQAGVVDGVADSTGAGLPDRLVWAWFVAHRTPALDQVMITVSTVGNTVGMAVLALVGAAVLWRLRRRAEAALVVIAAVGSSLLITGFKNLYGRDRPPLAQRLTVETNGALPSGHSLGSMVVLGVLAVVVVLLVRRPGVQVLTILTAAAGIVTIGASRLYLGVHWMTDVLTGWLLGGAWLALCVTALVVLRHRRSRTSAALPQGDLVDGLPRNGTGR